MITYWGFAGSGFLPLLMIDAMFDLYNHYVEVELARNWLKSGIFVYTLDFYILDICFARLQLQMNKNC
jgi:hypothetical protein